MNIDAKAFAEKVFLILEEESKCPECRRVALNATNTMQVRICLKHQRIRMNASR